MIIGVDPGERRVGIAVADTTTGFARPLEVIDAHKTDPVGRIAQLVQELEASVVVVGQPVTLAGSSGDAARAARDLVEKLRERVNADVVEHDERLTTVVAEQGLRASGSTRARRKELRDAVAAQVMLQGYLDARR
jgi:putative holliday junction resolvase